MRATQLSSRPSQRARARRGPISQTSLRTLNEADEILAKLRELAVINAKATYMNIGVGNRMGPRSAVRNQAMLDEIDNQLLKFGVSAGDRRELSSSYVKLMGFDFYMLFARTMERYIGFKQDDMVARLSKEPENTALKEELERWREGRKSWNPNYALFSQLNSYSLEDEINRTMPTWFGEKDKQGVLTFRN